MSAPDSASTPRAGADALFRHSFAGGALELASHILGSSSAGVFVAGLIGPYVAALDHPPGMSSGLVLGAAAICLGFSMAAGLGAMVLRGLGRCASHAPRRLALTQAQAPRLEAGDA